MTFEITNNQAFKVENGQYFDVSALFSEICSLVNNHAVSAGLKYNYKPSGKYIYCFKALENSSLYKSHGIDRVKIKVNSNDTSCIDYLDNLTNKINNTLAYKTSKDIFEVGLIDGVLVDGYSIVTYATEKNTDLVKKGGKKKVYHNLSKVLIF